MSFVDPRYYAYWLAGLAAVGGVLLLASNRGAVHVLVAAVELIVSWALAVGFSLLLI